MSLIDKSDKEDVVRVPFIRCRICQAILYISKGSDSDDVFAAFCDACNAEFKLTLTKTKRKKRSADCD